MNRKMSHHHKCFWLIVVSVFYLQSADAQISKNDLHEYKSQADSSKSTFQTMDDRQLDAHAKNTPLAIESNIPALVKYLMIPASNDQEKVQLIFTWISAHIRYDAVSFNTKKLLKHSANHVLTTRKAICDGYSNLFKTMCIEAGLEAEVINGYAKGYGFRQGQHFKTINHSWNAVKIEQQWQLFDVTWGSSFGVQKNGQLISKQKFEPFWFNTDPKAFIFTHLPLEKEWQFIIDSITLNEFEAMPLLNETFFKLGFDADTIFSFVREGGLDKLVETFSIDINMKGIQLPYLKTIKRTEFPSLTFESAATEMVLIDSAWHPFLKTEQRFSISHKPLGNKIEIAAKRNNNEKEYFVFMRYEIIE